MGSRSPVLGDSENMATAFCTVHQEGSEEEALRLFGAEAVGAEACHSAIETMGEGCVVGHPHQGGAAVAQQRFNPVCGKRAYQYVMTLLDKRTAMR